MKLAPDIEVALAPARHHPRIVDRGWVFPRDAGDDEIEPDQN